VLRLRAKREIEATFRQGRRFHSRPVVLHARRRSEGAKADALPRVTVIAGRPFRTAVARNRARRVLREACRLALGQARGPWDLVLIARPEALGLSLAARLEAVTGLLQRAGVLGEETAADEPPRDK
jgi:ribonuclease P protein component